MNTTFRSKTCRPAATFLRQLSSLAALFTGLGLITTKPVTAQTFTVRHSFTARPEGINYDGAYPAGRLIANPSGNILYGTANLGGSNGFGTVFAVNTDGTDFTTLHSFNYFTHGSQPLGGLVLSGNTLYGTAWQGGTAFNGAVFAVNTDGTGFTNLHNFTASSGPLSTNSDGAKSRAGLILSGSRLYGTAEYGGSAGNGTVFALNTDGTGFTNLHNFTATAYQPPYPNTDGIRPRAGLILSSNTLYGTAVGGGSYARGTVFKLNTNGGGFTTLHSFPPTSGSQINSEGAGPVAGLVLSGDTLYGTTESGGSFGQGVVFRLNTDGTGFTVLHHFFHATDGYYANAMLILSGNTLYGAAIGSGMFGGGTLFALNTDGTGFTVLHHLINDNDGGGPDTLVLVGNSLYGVARDDGSFDNGTVFSLSFNPQLTITPSGADLILTWPTNVAGFDYAAYTLESTTNVLSPAGWSTNLPAPVIVNGQNTVTTTASEPQRFFRLKSP